MLQATPPREQRQQGAGMNTTLLKAEQLLVSADHELLEFAQQLHHGCWENWNTEAAAHMISFSQRIHAALDLIKHSDGFQDTPPTLTIQ